MNIFKTWFFLKQEEFETLFILKNTHKLGIRNKKRIVSIKLGKSLGCPLVAPPSYINTIIGWKRNGVSIFSGIYRQWNCYILFESLITNSKVFSYNFKRVSMQMNLFWMEGYWCIEVGLSIYVFCQYSKTNILLLF